MSELAEGARLEIVYAPKGYLGFESPSLRQFSLADVSRETFSLDRAAWRGGRAVECGGLENRFTCVPGNEGSNPSSSASYANQSPLTEGGSFWDCPFRKVSAIGICRSRSEA